MLLGDFTEVIGQRRFAEMVLGFRWQPGSEHGRREDFVSRIEGLAA
jgi:hypothetical protein